MFDFSEINEVLLAAYRELSFAIRDGSNTLILNHKSLVHISDGRIIGEFAMIYGNTSTYDLARESLLSILRRDSLIQQFFQLDEEGEDYIKIRIIASYK